MVKTKATEQTAKEQREKNKLMLWAKTHKKKIVGIGAVTTIVVAFCLALKHEDQINGFCEELKDTIKNGPYLSERWRENVALEKLHETRALIHDEYLNLESDGEYKELCWKAMELVDKSIRKREENGREYGFPVYSGNGPYLQSDD